MAFRLGLCGTHCCGKTTLTDDLRKVYDFPVITGIADKYTRPERARMETQLNICFDQIQAEKTASVTRDEFGHPCGFISDRTVIDNLAYSYMCRDANTKHSIFALEAVVIYHQIKDQVMSHIASDPYDLVVFVDEYFPIEDNGTRCVSETAQVFVYKFIDRFLRDWEVVTKETDRIYPVLRVNGTREERVKQVINYVETH